LSNQDLNKKILIDLHKSGFHSEMIALQRFVSAGWDTTGAASYFDLDEGKTREIDIRAHISFYDKLSHNCSVSNYYQIVAEVKKRKKPWIVFNVGSQDVGDFLGIFDGWQNLIFCEDMICQTHVIARAINESSLYQRLGWRGSGIHECFTKPEDPSKWYSAFIAVCKASESALKANSREKSGNNKTEKSPHMFFVMPVVILDGQLLSAKLDKENEILLEEIKYAAFDFDFKTKEYTRSRYRIDLVVLDNLSEYLEISRKRLKKIHNLIVKEAKVKTTSNNS